jgi:hypothetical protein
LTRVDEVGVGADDVVVRVVPAADGARDRDDVASRAESGPGDGPQRVAPTDDDLVLHVLRFRSSDEWSVRQPESVHSAVLLGLSGRHRESAGHTGEHHAAQHAWREGDGQPAECRNRSEHNDEHGPRRHDERHE